MKKIGIYAGTFDPIHNGHISFALQAINQTYLSKVFFMVEPKPRYKNNVTALDLRLNMLNIAIKPHPKLKLLSLNGENFSVAKTLPQLKANFADTQLVFLFGSDVFCHIPSWESATRLADIAEFIVAIRNNQDSTTINKTASEMRLKTTVLRSQYQAVSSQKIRQNIYANSSNDDIPPKVCQYIKKHNIYSKPMLK